MDGAWIGATCKDERKKLYDSYGCCRGRDSSHIDMDGPVCSEPPTRLLRLARAPGEPAALNGSRPDVVPLEAAVLEVVAQDTREEPPMTNDSDRRLGAREDPSLEFVDAAEEVVPDEGRNQGR